MKEIIKAAQNLLGLIEEKQLYEVLLPANEQLRGAILNFQRSRARFAQLQTIRILKPFATLIKVQGSAKNPRRKVQVEGIFERGDKAIIISRDDTTITCATPDPAAAVFTLQKEDENRLWEYCFKGINYDN